MLLCGSASVDQVGLITHDELLDLVEVGVDSLFARRQDVFVAVPQH